MSNMYNRFVFFAVIGICITACGGRIAEQQAQSTVALRQHEVFTLTTQPLRTSLTLPAELKPFEEVDIYPRASGYVKRIVVDRGSLVKKGSLLAIIDAPEVFADQAAAEAEVQRAESNSMGVAAAFRSSRDNYERTLQAAATPGALSERDIIRATNQMKADSAAYAATQNALAVARSAYDARKQLSDYLTIRAPFDGIISERNIHTGSYVSTQGGENRQPLFRLETVDRLRLVIPVPEQHLGTRFDKDTVLFTVNSTPGIRYSAVVVRRAGSVDMQTRTETIEADVENTDGKLKGGSFAQAELIYRKESTFLVPASAVVTNMEGQFVIRVSNRKAERVPVQKGTVVDGQIEVFGRLTAGDELLLDPSDTIHDNDEIEIKKKEINNTTS